MFLLCLYVVIQLLSKEFQGCFTFSGVQVSEDIFMSCLFCLSEGCFIIFRCSLIVFTKEILWIFRFTFSGVRVSEFVCRRFSRFRCQRVPNSHSVSFSCLIVFRSCVFCLSGSFMVYVLESFFMSCVFFLSEGFMVGEFLHVQSVCQWFWYQMVSLCPVFCFCGFMVYVRGFLHVSFLCLSEFGVSEGCFKSIVWCV